MDPGYYINYDNYEHGVMTAKEVIQRYWYSQAARVRITGGKKMWSVTVTGWEFAEMVNGTRFKSKRKAKAIADWVKLNILYHDTTGLRLSRLSIKETAEGIITEEMKNRPPKPSRV